MKTRRTHAFLLCAALALAVFSPAHADGEGALQSVVGRMNSLGAFRAAISITTGDGFIRGTMSFQGGKFHMAMSDGRVIASNGREVTVYSPATGTAGKQSIFGGGGLGWILKGFKAKVSGSSAHLTAEDANSRIAEVRLKWNADFTLTQISILPRSKADSSDWTTIAISDIRAVEGFPSSLFSWHPPAGSRTVENPLNQSN